MMGMDAATGRPLAGAAHLAQSIARILSTPVGSRVMRREFGSMLPALVDQPFNAATRTRMYGATATALMRWEPRLRLTSVAIDAGSTPGTFTVSIHGRRTDLPHQNELETFTVPLSSHQGSRHV